MNRKQKIIEALRCFTNQRSGIEFANYGNREAFMGDYRSILRAGREGRQLLREVELRDSITADKIIEATRAFSGRLQIIEPREGGAIVDYTTGQYFPTEYRNAACAVLALCLWDYAAPDYKTADAIRTWARKNFGRGIQSRWFNWLRLPRTASGFNP
jgi:hypothetical protein